MQAIEMQLLKSMPFIEIDRAVILRLNDILNQSSRPSLSIV